MIRINKNGALRSLLAPTEAEEGYVALAIVEADALTGETNESQVGRIACPAPHVYADICAILAEEIPAGARRKVRVRRYDADGRKRELLVRATHEAGTVVRTSDGMKKSANVALPSAPAAAPEVEPSRAGDPEPPASALAAAATEVLASPAPSTAVASHVPVEDSARLYAELVRKDAELARKDAEIARKDNDLALQAGEIRALISKEEFLGDAARAAERQHERAEERRREDGADHRQVLTSMRVDIEELVAANESLMEAVAERDAEIAEFEADALKLAEQLDALEKDMPRWGFGRR